MFNDQASHEVAQADIQQLLRVRGWLHVNPSLACPEICLTDDGNGIWPSNILQVLLTFMYGTAKRHMTLALVYFIVRCHGLMFTRPLRALRMNKLEKIETCKIWKTTNSKSAKSNKIKEGKRRKRKDKKKKQTKRIHMDLSISIFVCIYCAFSVCCCTLHSFLFASSFQIIRTSNEWEHHRSCYVGHLSPPGWLCQASKTKQQWATACVNSPSSFTQ